MERGIVVLSTATEVGTLGTVVRPGMLSALAGSPILKYALTECSSSGVSGASLAPACPCSLLGLPFFLSRVLTKSAPRAMKQEYDSTRQVGRVSATLGDVRLGRV